MIVYRITLAIHSMKLLASGYPARWNSKDLHMNFNVMQIVVPEEIVLQKIKETDLIKGWKEFDKMPYTQSLGDQWVRELKSAILQVPSTIVSGDSNYLLNPWHKDFQKIKLIRTDPFE